MHTVCLTPDGVSAPSCRRRQDRDASALVEIRPAASGAFPGAPGLYASPCIGRRSGILRFIKGSNCEARYRAGSSGKTRRSFAAALSGCLHFCLVRQPRLARSIEVLVEPKHLPELL